MDGSYGIQCCFINCRGYLAIFEEFNEFERIVDEMVVAFFKVLSWNCLERLSKTTEKCKDSWYLGNS
jgi:hypothetical protein